MAKSEKQILNELFKDAKPMVFGKGEALPVKDQVYLLETGYVGLFEQATAELRKLLFIYRSGEFFPFIYLDGKTSDSKPLVYAALEAVSVRALPKKEFEQRVFSDIEYARAIIKLSSELLQMAIERIGNLGNADTMTRLVARLIFSARRFGLSDGQKTIITVPLTHTEMAQAIGTSRETVNRLMRRLQKQKIVEMRDRLVVVNEMDKLIDIRDGVIH